MDWNSVIKAKECSYILGNPPFLGHSMRDSNQVSDMHRIWGTDKQVNRLDYVTCWFKKSIDYIAENDVKVGFVATNSICQGEQVPILWPEIFKSEFNIFYAHRTFEWGNEARGKAAVHCVIIGLSKKRSDSKYVFDYETYRSEPTRRRVNKINGYLVDADEIYIPPRSRSRSDLPKITKGSQPTDGARIKIDGNYVTRSNLILDEIDKTVVLNSEPQLAPYLRPFVGSDELISGEYRWCFWLVNCPPNIIRSSSVLKPRLERVREGRLLSSTDSVKKMADMPTVFTQIRQPSTSYIAIPRVSSLNRQYFPIAFLSPDIIASDALITIPNGELHHFAVLMSCINVAWVKTLL